MLRTGKMLVTSDCKAPFVVSCLCRQYISSKLRVWQPASETVKSVPNEEYRPMFCQTSKDSVIAVPNINQVSRYKHPWLPCHRFHQNRHRAFAVLEPALQARCPFPDEPDCPQNHHPQGIPATKGEGHSCSRISQFMVQRFKPTASKQHKPASDTPICKPFLCSGTFASPQTLHPFSQQSCIPGGFTQITSSIWL